MLATQQTRRGNRYYCRCSPPFPIVNPSARAGEPSRRARPALRHPRALPYRQDSPLSPGPACSAAGRARLWMLRLQLAPTLLMRHPRAAVLRAPSLFIEDD